MKGSYRKRGCTCAKGKKCICGATWSFRIDIGIDPRTGRRKQKEQGGFRTRALAVDAATKLYSEVTGGTFVNEQNTTFKAFAPEWLKMYQSTGKVKQGTVLVRSSRLKTLSKYFDHYKLKDITKKMYQDMLIDLKAKGYAHETLISINATGKMIFRKAMELEIIKKTPAYYAIIPGEQKVITDEIEEEIPKYLEKEELALFLQTAKEKGLPYDYAMFLTMAYTGIRVGELCVLKYKDIDFKAGTININKTLYNPSNNVHKCLLVPPKTKSSKRIIEVDSLVLNYLDKHHRAEQNKIHMKYRKIYHDKDFVFPKSSHNPGYPEYQKTIDARMKRLLKLAGLNENLTPHSLRHTHTSLLAEAGVNLEAIMDRLGHKNDDITRNIYLHVTKSVKKEASQKFAELMRNL